MPSCNPAEFKSTSLKASPLKIPVSRPLKGRSINPKFQILREFYQDSADGTYEEPFVSTPRQFRLWSNDRSSDRDTSLSNFLPQFGSVAHYHQLLTRPDFYRISVTSAFQRVVESEWRSWLGAFVRTLGRFDSADWIIAHVHRDSLIFSRCQENWWSSHDYPTTAEKWFRG